MPYPATHTGVCATAGAECWACARMHGFTNPGRVRVPATLCWHGTENWTEFTFYPDDGGQPVHVDYYIDTPGRYPLCEACAQRWRSYRAPARLHTIG